MNEFIFDEKDDKSFEEFLKSNIDFWSH
jgi:hypothetical protein